MIKKLGMLLVLCGTLLLSGPKAHEQAAPSSPASADSQKASDQDMPLLRQDIRSKKKQRIAANLKLTDEESMKFWPVDDQKYALIKEYADAWGTIADEQALSYIKRWLAGLSQLRTFFGFFVLIFIVKRCVFSVAL